MPRRSRLLTPYIFNNRNWIPFLATVYIFSTPFTNETLCITNYSVTNKMKIVREGPFFNNTSEWKKGTEYWLWIVLLRTVTIENSLQYRTFIDDIFKVAFIHWQRLVVVCERANTVVGRQLITRQTLKREVYRHCYNRTQLWIQPAVQRVLLGIPSFRGYFWQWPIGSALERGKQALGL